MIIIFAWLILNKQYHTNVVGRSSGNQHAFLKMPVEQYQVVKYRETYGARQRRPFTENTLRMNSS